MQPIDMNIQQVLNGYIVRFTTYPRPGSISMSDRYESSYIANSFEELRNLIINYLEEQKEISKK